MKRLAAVLLFFALTSVDAFARVISYSPYTDDTAMRAYQMRTARHFVLVEADPNGIAPLHAERGRVVLYDAHGKDEPRVIYPQDGGVFAGVIHAAALFQENDDTAPTILIHITNGTRATLLSTDAGATWTPLPELDGKPVANFHSSHELEPDFGGPETYGLRAAIRIGTANVPFLATYGDGAYAISRSGTVRLLRQSAPTGPTLILGRNRTGTRALIQYGTDALSVDLDGNATTVATGLDLQSRYSGWLTDDGAAYLLRRRNDGRFLYLHRGGEKTFVIGPYGASDPGTTPAGGSRHRLAMFAIPTFDFGGAWIMQRDSAKPSTLSRHLASGGTETMWSDVTGPEVEALHAGSSGERLLIQVHRPRSRQAQIIDPALAIWTIGEPAPKFYDELYLAEHDQKGFVHLDVETIASGTPFVFDGGFQIAPDIVISPPISAPPGGGDVIQEWGVVRASLRQQLVLPGVARLPGAFSSFWRTDIVVYNPADASQDVEIRYVPIGQAIAIADMPKLTMTLGPREIRVVADVLKSLFAIESGGGALHFIPEAGINVTGRTYTTAGEGSFGYGALAIDAMNAAGPRFPLSFSGAFPGGHYRTNILLTDTSGRGTATRLQAFGFYGAMGTSDVSIAAPANGLHQVNDIGGLLGISAIPGGLVLHPERGTVIPTVVAIDNRTNDPTYFPPDLPASIPRTIPVIGHLDGQHGSRFRSDLHLMNMSDRAQSVVLQMTPWSAQGSHSLTLTLLPHESRMIEDVLKRVWNVEGVARLRYSSVSSDVRVTSRTYNVDANGGTYGCLIPPLNAFQSATGGETLEILGVVGGSGFRTNLALVDLSTVSAGRTTRVRVSIFDDKGASLDTFEISLPLTGGMQINDLFGSRGLTPPAAARIVVQALDSIGLVGAYATLTDNITNDATYLAAQLGARP